MWMPTGQIWDTTTEPTAPPDAAKLSPRARIAVGKIYDGSIHEIRTKWEMDVFGTSEP